MIWAIVPAKTLEHAKTRLAQALSPAERQALSLAMLRDVLSALKRAENLDHVAVVTADAALAAAANALDVEVIPEQTTGQNEALAAGVAYARSQGASEVLIVSADLPLLCAETVEQLIEEARAWQEEHDQLVLLAPSRDGTGTNALLQRPPGVIPLLFGVNSLPRHQQAAAALGVPVELMRARGLAFDVDVPADLVELASHPGKTHTQTALIQMGLPQRLHERFQREPSVP
jgi:2-phospho-L-lactate guanylyltransferase